MSSTSYFYSSTTNTTDAGTTTGHRYSTASTTDVDGLTIVRTAHQDFGQPVVIEERRYDRSGQEQLPLPPIANETQRITDLDEETTTYGDDSGMAIYALSTQDGTMWDPANRGKATYGYPHLVWCGLV